MSSIKTILNNLNENDKQLWQNCRTDMHRSYLNVLHQALGIDSIDSDDIAFTDLIDIKLALIFERAGRFRDLVSADNADADKLEAAINEQAKSLEALRNVSLEHAPMSGSTCTIKAIGWN
jgi:hypothetical protein